MSNRNEVWLIETDEIKDFKFYFVSYNASTLEYLSMQKTSKSVFGWYFILIFGFNVKIGH